MNQIWKDLNYILVLLDGETIPLEYPCGKSVYSEMATRITLHEDGKGTFTIDKADIIAGEWEDNLSNVLSENDVITFLRTNTGFNTASGGSEAITTTVNISSAQILAMGTSPIDLLPFPGVNKFYDIGKIILEYSAGSLPFVFPTSPTFYIDGAFDAYIDKSVLTSSFGNAVVVLQANVRNTITVGIGSGNVKVLYNKDILNSNLILGTTNVDNPVLGDGTLRAIITYTVRTFGL